MEKTAVEPISPPQKPHFKRKSIPKELIYEMVDGNPIYYRDYKKVLSQKKSLEEVMGSSSLQAQLVALIIIFLGSKLNLRRYALMSNELGFIYTPKNWRILDIAIFEKKHIKNELLSTKYIQTAPKIVIEIDTKADLKKGDMFAYITKKTDDLLDSGVEKVIWILTGNKKVLLAEPGQQWRIADWRDDIPVIEDIVINVEELVKTATEVEDG